ncbi:MAG: DUF3883 domain-containing protein [Marinilabilia sp.]
MPTPWSTIEISLIVADYFNMLAKELKGELYSKAEHRRALLPLLANRSEGSVEFKHQNISAVLANMGQPYIKGYLPRFNYQRILEKHVAEYLENNYRNFEYHFKNFAEKEIPNPSQYIHFENFIVSPPKPDLVHEYKPPYEQKAFVTKTNYLEKEQQNTRLGQLGEELVLEYEKWALSRIGQDKWMKEVRWISKEEGDVAGFDILSKDFRGKDKYIEVKTTKLTSKTPIFFSRNELEFSVNHSNEYYLYRLFDFESKPQMFQKQGSLNKVCHSEAVSFKGYF